MWAEYEGEITSYNARREEGFIRVDSRSVGRREEGSIHLDDRSAGAVHFHRRRLDDATHDPQIGEKVTFLLFVDRIGGSRVASARRIKVVAGAPVPR
jgi:hypothetical protein